MQELIQEGHYYDAFLQTQSRAFRFVSRKKFNRALEIYVELLVSMYKKPYDDEFHEITTSSLGFISDLIRKQDLTDSATFTHFIAIATAITQHFYSISPDNRMAYCKPIRKLLPSVHYIQGHPVIHSCLAALAPEDTDAIQHLALGCVRNIIPFVLEHNPSPAAPLLLSLRLLAQGRVAWAAEVEGSELGSGLVLAARGATPRGIRLLEARARKELSAVEGSKELLLEIHARFWGGDLD